MRTRYALLSENLSEDDMRLFPNQPKWFTKRVVRSGDCLLWTGLKNKGGYGVLEVNRKSKLAHRVSYELYNGSIVDGLDVMHSCDVRNCVNPNHLSQGTRQDNVDDCLRKNRNVYGEKVKRSKLKESEVLDVLRLVDNGLPQRKIAKMYNVSVHAVWSVKTGRTWSRLTGKG